MTLFLSVPEFLSQQPDAVELQQTPQQLWTIPLKDTIGGSYGYRQRVNLRRGLDLRIEDYTLQEDLVVEVGKGEPREPRLCLEMSFMLCGHNRDEGVQPHHNFLECNWGASDGGQFHWQAGQHVLKFDIHIYCEQFEHLINRQFQALPSTLSQIFQNPLPTQQGFWQIAPTTAAMQSAIYQILKCPYHGLTRWLYWEGKVLELVALRLEQVTQYPQQAASDLQPDDVARIHYAGDLLRQRLSDPPSLLELARLIGLNDYKLKQGFRQVFNTTVFGYLTQRRMEKACQLLVQRHTVAVVAAAVGYASPTAFSGAFRRRFGISPKRYQVEKRVVGR